MSYSYTLRNIQTGIVEYTGLKAGEVHQITGISSQRVSRHVADGKVYGNTWKVSLDEDDYSEFWTDEMCMKWDCVRKMVLGGLKFGVRMITGTGYTGFRRQLLRRSTGSVGMRMRTFGHIGMRLMRCMA